MKEQSNKVESGRSLVAPPLSPAQIDKPKKPRLSELPGFIPIRDTARIAAALNRDAFLRVMAKVIFAQNTTNVTPNATPEQPIQRSA